MRIIFSTAFARVTDLVLTTITISVWSEHLFWFLFPEFSWTKLISLKIFVGIETQICLFSEEKSLAKHLLSFLRLLITVQNLLSLWQLNVTLKVCSSFLHVGAEHSPLGCALVVFWKFPQCCFFPCPSCSYKFLLQLVLCCPLSSAAFS